MDTALVLITVGSAAAALIMAAIAWRVIREERRRSAARVIALRAELARAEDEVDLEITPARSGGRLSAALETPAAPRVRDASVSVPTVFATDATSGFGSVTGHEDQLFSAVQRPSTSRATMPALWLALTALVIVVGGAFFMSGRANESRTAPAGAAASEAPALELVSMRHSHEGNNWTITGLVRNPAGGADVTRLNVVAFLFARDGSFISSGRAPLDFATLAPGDESPFVVTTSSSAAIGRYRISFRTDDGRMVRHVDKRPAVKTAELEGTDR